MPLPALLLMMALLGQTSGQTPPAAFVAPPSATSQAARIAQASAAGFLAGGIGMGLGAWMIHAQGAFSPLIIGLGYASIAGSSVIQGLVVDAVSDGAGGNGALWAAITGGAIGGAAGVGVLFIPTGDSLGWLIGKASIATALCTLGAVLGYELTVRTPDLVPVRLSLGAAPIKGGGAFALSGTF